jgi:opacity protein-like surface antigen
MKRMLGVIAGVALAGAVFTTAAEAQGVQFGIGGGLTMPMGDAGDVMKSGFHGQGSAQFNPGLPFALRADVMYHSMDGKSFGGFGGLGTTRVIAGTVNGVFPFGTPGGTIQPYATAGLGMYNVKMSVDFDLDLEFSDMALYTVSATGSETKLGLNGGAGLRANLSGLSTFAEVRYHHITTSGSAIQMIPVTVGIVFGR